MPIPRFWAGELTASDLDPSFALPSTAIAQGGIIPNQIGLPVRNASGSPITAGSLVYTSGWHAASGLQQISLADADAGGAPAVWIVLADIANGANGLVGRHFLSPATLNTNAGNVGDPVYLSTTAGTWTLTAPTAGNALQQIVGRIVVKSATVGQIDFDLESSVLAKSGTNELQLLSITGALESINTGTRQIEVSLPDTGTIGTIPTTGNVVALVRTPTTGTLAGVAFYSVGSLATDDTNFVTLDVTDLGTAGAGSTAMLATSPAGVNTTKTTGGQAFVANGREILTPNPSQACTAGNILRIRATVSGTLGGTVTGCHMALMFLPTT